MGARVTEKFEDPHFPRVRGFPGFWIPGPSCLVGPGSLQGPVPRPLCSRTLRVIPHTTQHWVLASFAVDPGVRNRRNSAPDPDSAPPVPAPPSGARRVFPGEYQPLRPQDPLRSPASRPSFLPATRGCFALSASARYRKAVEAAPPEAAAAGAGESRSRSQGAGASAPFPGCGVIHPAQLRRATLKGPRVSISGCPGT